jgi:hypothetical protein
LGNYNFIVRGERKVPYLVDRGGLIDPKTGKRIYSPNQLLRPSDTDDRKVKLEFSSNRSDQVNNQASKGED